MSFAIDLGHYACEWMIWSSEHNAWWACNRKGYARRVEKAGRYSFVEAVKICRDACFDGDWTKNESGLHGKPPEEVMVPAPELIGRGERLCVGSDSSADRNERIIRAHPEAPLMPKSNDE